MGSRTRNNIVTFRPLQGDQTSSYGPRCALTLDSPWKLSGGLSPNMNSATVSYKEFDKIAGLVNNAGSVEFWYTGEPGGTTAPDVTLHGWRIAEVRPRRLGFAAEPGRPAPPGADGPYRALVYAVYFADAREQFVFPRGGRLFHGLINQGLTPAANVSGLELDTPTLVRMCLNAMGIAATLPTSLAQVPAPRNLEWYGAHAPAELAKLLELSACVFCPLADGTFAIQLLHTFGDPQITGGDDRLPTVAMPLINRRGKFVVVTSSEPITDTLKLAGPRDDQFYFVAQDSDDKWKKYDDISLIQNGDEFDEGGMLANFQDDFTRIDAKYRDRLRRQAYQFLVLGNGTGQMPPGSNPIDRRIRNSAAPVLLRQLTAGGPETPGIQVTARRATRGDGGLWTNPPGQVVCHAESCANDKSNPDVNRIMISDGPLVGVQSPTMFLANQAKELKPGDITISFSIHRYQQFPRSADPSAPLDWKPIYYRAAFKSVNGDPVRLPDDVAGALLASPNRDTVVIVRPDMQLFFVNDNPQNLTALDAAAASLAGKALAGSEDPVKITQVVGWAACPIDGLVSSVSWSQDPTQTTIEANNWYRPLGALPHGYGEKWLDAHSGLSGAGSGAGGGSGSGGVAASPQARHVAEGAAGARPPTMQLNPIPPLQTLPPGSVIASLTGIPAPGLYAGTVYGGYLSSNGTGGLSLPGGLVAGDQVLCANLDENGLTTNRLALGSFVVGTYVGPSDEQNPMPTIAFHGGVGDTGGVSLTAANTTNADGHSWNRDTDTAGQGCIVDVQTRTFWDPLAGGGNGAEYMFTRSLTIDARGMIARVGTEEKTLILTGIPGCS